MDEKSLVPIVGQRYVHPDNMRLQAVSQRAIALPDSVVKRLKKEQKHLTTTLTKSGYFELKQRYAMARDEFNSLIKQRVELQQEGNELATPELRQLKRAVIVARQIQQQMRRYQAEIVALKRTELKLKQHEAGLEREAAVKHAERILRADSIELAEIITTTLTQLGYCYRWSENGREFVRSVKIEIARNTPDCHYFKLLVTSKGWFGWVPEMPRGVNPVDLMQEKVVLALESALQRRIEAVQTTNNGYWYKVYRLQTADGIIDSLQYRDIVPSTSRYPRGNVPIALGVGEGRQETIISLAHYPHLLVAGMSGSGKSNMVKNIISTIITNHSPEEVRLVLVDMKEGLEFKTYEDNEIPHLIGNVVKTPFELATVLSGLETMRIERSHTMSRVYAVNIDQYNERVPDSMRMPRVVVIIDEFGAIYMNDPNSEERENKRIANQCKSFIRQLLAKARSSGIHVIICTQTPYAEILPGPDKANIAVKIAGRLPTQASSRVVLDNVDAAALPDDPRGRMIVSVNGLQWQLQTPFVSETDVNNAIEIAKGYNNPVSIEIVPPPSVKLTFTADDMIALALDNYDGLIAPTRMWRDGIKDMRLLSFRECLDLGKKITSNESVTYNGQIYELVSVKGGGKRLVGLRSAQNPTLPIDTNSAENLAELTGENPT